ncbi:MAG: hypothetical protein JW833_06195 [Prolixibacteraceae bacterium]|nr:hypothetical protein [Prolixibacteraceae bacterium]
MQLDKKILDELERNIAEYCDEEILNILKKRKHYNPNVARMAINEAINRKIIYSEDDLLSEDFKVEPLKFRIFPEIEKKEIKIKLIRSLTRGILLTGIIPTILGFLRLSENKMAEAFILLCLGGVWIVSAALLMKTYQSRFIYLIMGMGGLSVIYVVNILLQLKPFSFLDLLVAIILYGVIYYSLLYINSLLKKIKKEN